jgi:hypothetical protein
MAIPSILAVAEVTAGSTQHEGRKHLQRLIRKVKHVLAVKRCIDDLKGGGGLRQCRGILEKTYVHSAPFPIGSNCTFVATLISASNCLHTVYTRHCARSLFKWLFRDAAQGLLTISKETTYSMDCPLDPQPLQNSATWMAMHLIRGSIMPNLHV